MLVESLILKSTKKKVDIPLDVAWYGEDVDVQLQLKAKRVKVYGQDRPFGQIESLIVLH